MRVPRFILLLLISVSAAGAEPAAGPVSPFELRMVELPGPLGRPDLDSHLDHLRRAGYNAVWVRAHQLTADPLAERVAFEPVARGFAADCSGRGLRLFVSVDPALAVGERYALSDPELVEALRRFAKRVRRELRAADLVLSFEGARPRLSEIRDVLAYGLDPAPAHVDLAERLSRRLPRRMRLWFHPSGLFTGNLPASVGLVWEGSGSPAERVDASELDRLRVATGERETLLRDRYPANQAYGRMPLAHNLGPLRDRDPALATRLAGHVTVMMEDWGASRLTLATVADWLRDPGSYDPQASWEAAMRRLAGDAPEALEALRTQALEWGGPIGGLNHHTAVEDNPTAVSRVLRDPALAARWKWTLTRYPQRIEALSGLADEAFRRELLEVMARRLAIARAIPTTREILARQAAGRGDLMSLIDELNRLRGRTAPASARSALDRFLAAAGLLELLAEAEDAPPLRD